MGLVFGFGFFRVLLLGGRSWLECYVAGDFVSPYVPAWLFASGE